jgi:transcriptional antiterminator NusG
MNDENIDSVTSSESNKPKLRRYVVQAFSGYEARVQKTLTEHIGIHGLEDKFGQILVPTEEVVEMRSGQTQ